MKISERLRSLCREVEQAPSPEQLKELFELVSQISERLVVLEDLASERQLDCEELFARCDGLEDDLRELAEGAGYDFEEEITSDDLDASMIEVACDHCGSLVLAHRGSQDEAVTCPCCGADLELGD